MRAKLLIVSAAMLIAASMLGGCTQSFSSGKGNGSSPSGDSTLLTIPASKEIKRAELTENAAFAAELRAEPELVEAGRDAALVFTVRNREGGVARDLKVVHEKLMHLLIVSDDLAQFDHVHPEQQPDGTFRINYKFPNGGVYKLYADFTPQGSPQIVNVFDIGVGGAARTRTPLVADTNFTKSFDGLNFTLKANQPIRAGAGTMLDFYVTDAAGNAVTDLQPYLGAMAHFVVISEDTTKFLHVHAIEGETTESKGTGGHQGDKDSHGDMEMDVKPNPENGARPTVQAHTEFPVAGLYKMWGQFQRGGKVFTVPFILNIAPGEADTASTAEIPTDAIKINVSSSGFEPSKVNVKMGETVKLAFTRKDSSNCASEVVFSKLNIKKALPAGKTTVIEIKPSQLGELEFACGMGMLKGTLIAE